MASKPQAGVEQSIIVFGGEGELEILLTDTGNARRLKEECGDDCRFCLEEKVWYVWNDELGVWRKDPLELQVSFKAKLTFQKLRSQWRTAKKEIEPKLESFKHKLTKKLEPRADKEMQLTHDESDILNNYTQAAALEHWYTISENATRISSAIIMLRSEPRMAIHTGQFDADPYLFNCANGTFDLRESTVVREHRREDFCSMQAPVTADWSLGAEQRPLFEDFLQRIMPDKDKLLFLQRYFGLALSGLADERVIPILLGGGANGKGVWLRVMNGILGEDGGYACMAAMSSFLQPKFSNADETRNDLVALIGKRLVTVSETNTKSPPLNAALLKCFAGGDGNLRIRGNWESLRNFTPTGKLILATNNEPQIDDDSDGMWDRTCKVWFDVQVPKAEQDVDLVNKILATEKSAILAWMLEGWAAYWNDRQTGNAGLTKPVSIEKDTTEYRDSQSQVAAFIQACYWIVKQKDGIPQTSTAIYERYKHWCDATGERHKTQTSMAIELLKFGRRNGITKERKENGIYWYGLKPSDMVQPDPNP